MKDTNLGFYLGNVKVFFFPLGGGGGGGKDTRFVFKMFAYCSDTCSSPNSIPYYRKLTRIFNLSRINYCERSFPRC